MSKVSLGILGALIFITLPSRGYCQSLEQNNTDYNKVGSRQFPTIEAYPIAPVSQGGPLLSRIDEPESPVTLSEGDAQGALLTSPDFNNVSASQEPLLSRIDEPASLPVTTTATATVNEIQEAEPAPSVSQEIEIPVEAPQKEMLVAAKKEYAASDSTALWQSAFIKNLVGGDGTLALIPEEQDAANNTGEVVRLDQAVSIALENNPQIKAAVEAARSKELDKIGAYSQFLPVVQLDLAKGREHSRPASYNDSLGNRVTDNWHDRHDRVLTIRQPLLDLGYLSDIATGHDREDIANLDRKNTQDTIASDSVTAYLRLIQSKISIQLAEQYKGYLDDLAQKMKARVEGGGASNADLDRIISRSSQAENARVEAESEYQTSLLELQRLTGSIPLKIKVPDAMAPIIPENTEAALAQAYKQNASYLASLKKIDAANDDRNKAYSAMAPKVYAQYSSGYSYNPGGAANGNPIDGVYPSQRTDAAMLVAQWTLNGGVPVAGGLSASARARQASMESLDIRQRMDQGIHVSYTALETSRDRLEVLQKAVEANERVIAGFEEQYQNGTRSAFELLDAYEQLYNSRLNLMRVIFAYTQASYQVRLQMGDIVPSIIGSRGAQ